jgi:hypothetical protein
MDTDGTVAGDRTAVLHVCTDPQQNKTRERNLPIVGGHASDVRCGVRRAPALPCFGCSHLIPVPKKAHPPRTRHPPAPALKPVPRVRYQGLTSPAITRLGRHNMIDTGQRSCAQPLGIPATPRQQNGLSRAQEVERRRRNGLQRPTWSSLSPGRRRQPRIRTVES